MGFEPTTPRVTGECANRYATGPSWPSQLVVEMAFIKLFSKIYHYRDGIRTRNL